MSINWFWSKTLEVRCADGSTRFVYKNIDDAFPLQIAQSSTELSGQLSGLGEAAGKLELKNRAEIKGLLFSLNEQNQSLMMSFRSAYLSYSTNPCGDGGFLQREIQKLLEEQRKISTLKIKVHALIEIALANPGDTARLNVIYGEIASIQGGAVAAPLAAEEIAENRHTAVQLLTGEHDVR